MATPRPASLTEMIQPTNGHTQGQQPHESSPFTVPIVSLAQLNAERILPNILTNIHRAANGQQSPQQTNPTPPPLPPRQQILNRSQLHPYLRPQFPQQQQFSRTTTAPAMARMTSTDKRHAGERNKHLKVAEWLVDLPCDQIRYMANALNDLIGSSSQYHLNPLQRDKVRLIAARTRFGLPSQEPMKTTQQRSFVKKTSGRLIWELERFVEQALWKEPGEYIDSRPVIVAGKTFIISLGVNYAEDKQSYITAKIKNMNDAPAVAQARFGFETQYGLKKADVAVSVPHKLPPNGEIVEKQLTRNGQIKKWCNTSGSLVVHVLISVYNEVATDVERQDANERQHRHTTTGKSSLYVGDKMPAYDVTLVVDEAKIEAHRFVLATSSSVFRQMIEKSDERQIFLEDEDGEAMQRLVNYMYTNTIKLSTLTDAVRMAELASRYKIDAMMVEIETFLRTNIQPSDAVTVYPVTNKFGMRDARVDCVRYAMDDWLGTRTSEDFRALKRDQTTIALEMALDAIELYQHRRPPATYSPTPPATTSATTANGKKKRRYIDID